MFVSNPHSNRVNIHPNWRNTKFGQLRFSPQQPFSMAKIIFRRWFSIIATFAHQRWRSRDSFFYLHQLTSLFYYDCRLQMTHFQNGHKVCVIGGDESSAKHILYNRTFRRVLELWAILRLWEACSLCLWRVDVRRWREKRALTRPRRRRDVQQSQCNYSALVYRHAFRFQRHVLRPSKGL